MIARALIGMAAGLAMTGGAYAQPSRCEVPGYLVLSEAALPHVAEAVKNGQKLSVLVVGTGSSALGGPDGAASSYPERLEVALQKTVTRVPVSVVSQIVPRNKTQELAATISKIIGNPETRPTLVIWQTGTVDAMRGVDPDDFQRALNAGVNAAHAAGADVILMNMQYSPRTETMIPLTGYLDIMRVVSQQSNTPLFDRFAIMRYWSEAGDFNFFAPTHNMTEAKRVHECLGKALALYIVDLVRQASPDIKVTP